MHELARGQKSKLADVGVGNRLEVGVRATLPGGRVCDVSCFGVDEKGTLSDDRYFIFYNQKSSPEGALTSIGGQSGELDRFRIDLDKLPASVHKLVFTATLDGAGTMAELQSAELQLVDGGQAKATFRLKGADFTSEKAVILLELYRKDVWRLAAVGQGFAGGLSALLAHFGGKEQEVATAGFDSTPTAPFVPVPSSASAVRLQKRVSLDKKMQEKAPALVNLAKKASLSLAKAGLSDHQAKVALCLDISASMGDFYDSGLVQTFAERILALGSRFDDDGEIDVFLFGLDGHQPAPLGVEHFAGYVDRTTQKFPLEGGTDYAKAMQLIRRAYFPDGKAGARSAPAPSAVPVYVMFLTDGDTQSKSAVEQQLRWSSYEPIFWQFMGIGASAKMTGGSVFAKLGRSNFAFLERLDDLSGRFIDNANFFSVPNLQTLSDEGLYDMLMAEYPGWLKLARQKGVLRPE